MNSNAVDVVSSNSFHQIRLTPVDLDWTDDCSKPESGRGIYERGGEGPAQPLVSGEGMGCACDEVGCPAASIAGGVSRK